MKADAVFWAPKVEEWVELWKGTIAIVKLDRDTPREELKHLIGTEVLLDGRPYTILGVESYAILTLRAGQPIGLLVSLRDTFPGDYLPDKSA